MFGSKRLQAASLAPAVNEYHRMIELDPTRADAYAGLGSALLELNRYEEAKRALTRACELRSDVPEYRIALSAALAADGAPDQGLAELLGSGRPVHGWKQAVAGAVASFGVGVLVLAALDDPAVALSLLITFGVIAYALRSLRRGWRGWRHRGQMSLPARPNVRTRTRIRSLTVGLIALALIAMPAVVQTEFDRLPSPWNDVLLGAYVALGLWGIWVGRRRRRRDGPAGSSGSPEPMQSPRQAPQARRLNDRALQARALQMPTLRELPIQGGSGVPKACNDA